MKRALICAMFALTVCCQNRSNAVEEELLKLEKEFARAVTQNDAEAIGQFLADDWVIIDSDGGVIDKSRFLSAIKSGALTHEMMESDDVKVRAYGDTAIVTALTTTKGKFAGQEFSARERATDFFVKQGGRWQCVFSQLTKFNRK
jgi:ketosteroid isomerase-like protein